MLKSIRVNHPLVFFSGLVLALVSLSGIAQAQVTLNKSFVPPTVALGDPSRLIFEVNPNFAFTAIGFMSFSDTLPEGMVIANPANLTNTCESYLSPPTITATPGTSTINFFSNGQLPNFPTLEAGFSCEVSLDVITNNTGSLLNISSDLTYNQATATPAQATLVVFSTPLGLKKRFLTNPANSGSEVDLEFTISNRDRDFPATGVAFADTISPMDGLQGLTPLGLPTNACGGTVSFDGTQINLNNASIAASSDCSFTVTIAIPENAPTGTYDNVTENLVGIVNGEMMIGNDATARLNVRAAPLFTKEFINDPSAAGDSVTVRYTISNGRDDGTIQMAFNDDFRFALPGLAANDLLSSGAVNDVCGTGSQLTAVNLSIDPVSGQGPAGPYLIQLTNGQLAAQGQSGDTCSFDVVLDVPTDANTGTVTSVSSELTGLFFSNENAFTGLPASDDLQIVGGPLLLKRFVSSPVVAGGQTLLEFQINNTNESAQVTGITFTDDLNAFLAGTNPVLPANPNPPCGAGSELTASVGDTLLTLSGGNLDGGATCTFSVPLNISNEAVSGTYTNTTSAIAATVAGVNTLGDAASADLQVGGLVFSKEYLDDPVTAGDTVTLRFTIDNVGNEDASSIVFIDNIASTLFGLTAISLPVNPCQANLSGSNTLIFVNGAVSAGTSCSFDVILQVPQNAAIGDYANTTSTPTAILNGVNLAFIAATDRLTITDNQKLSLTKEFTRGSFLPGGVVDLKFTITNLDAINTVTDIAFSDNLDAMLPGAVATQFPVACGGEVQTQDGGQTIEFIGGVVSNSIECSITIPVQIPANATPATYVNTSSAISGLIGGLAVEGPAATAPLVISSLVFTKSFDGPTRTSGQPELTFTLTNESVTDALTELAFTDDLDAVTPGLIAISAPQTDVCGNGSRFAGIDVLSLTGASLAPNSSCSFSVTLEVPADSAIGTFTNTTSAVTQNGLPLRVMASADLIVEATIGGTVSGLEGTGLTLGNGAASEELEISADGDFAFDVTYSSGSFFSVLILSQPTGTSKQCLIRNNIGVIQNTDVTNIQVICDEPCNLVSVPGITVDGMESFEACEDLIVGPGFTASEGADITLSSGEFIELAPGFRLGEGAVLDAEVCGQSLCETSSVPMPLGCHSCVDTICAVDPFCCDNSFDSICLDEVATECLLVCE